MLLLLLVRTLLNLSLHSTIASKKNISLPLLFRDQVCDYRCISGHQKDLHCNWKGLGETCRACFEDSSVAHVADEVAKSRGSRVIMCDTHEPPLPLGSSVHAGDGKTPNVTVPEGQSSLDSPGLRISAHTTAKNVMGDLVFGQITSGELCAFMPGYRAFLHEINCSVHSILHFMPGMRVRIASDRRDFGVFNR